MADPAAPELMAAKSAVTSVAARLTRAALAAIPTPRLANLAVLAVIAAAIFTVAGCGGSKNTAPVSPVREAAQYVQTLAHNAGVTILGDKVWSVRENGPAVIVVIRVRYVAVDAWTGQRVVGVTTIYVHLLRADYVVTG